VPDTFPFKEFYLLLLLAHISSISATYGGRCTLLLLLKAHTVCCYVICERSKRRPYVGLSILRYLYLRDYCGYFTSQNIASGDYALNFHIKLSYINNLSRVLLFDIFADRQIAIDLELLLRISLYRVI